ncbi:ATP-binding protein [Dyadobacter sp. NIV53]|uniref:tetratricopeptide repeat-containing sensor histidine kinase n=1 Tax=Dyadobacter sp. NIV53 TaxID=2861765 RepID=UPI001C88DB3D|nr:ATP-binding protein [Dyadobacter sp. NIV53]
MKGFCTSLLLWTFLVSAANGQRFQIDSLTSQLTKKQPDTSRILTMIQLANVYSDKWPDSSILIIEEAIKLAQRANYTVGHMRAASTLSGMIRYRGNLPKALASEFEILKMARTAHHRLAEWGTLNNIGSIYGDLGENRQALAYFFQTLAIAKEISAPKHIAFVLPNIANSYIKLGLLDSAQLVNQQAYQQLLKAPDRLLEGRILINSGRIEVLKGNTSQALLYFRKALPVLTIRYGNKMNNAYVLSMNELEMAALFDKLQLTDSCLYYAHRALMTAQDKIKLHTLKASSLLVKHYKIKNQIDSAFYYQEIARAVSDSLFGPEKFRELQKLLLAEQQNQQALITEQERYQNRIRTYLLITGLGVIGLIALFLLRINRQKNKTNQQLNEQNEEIDRQRSKAEKALTELTATQAQLIQKEKLASLGELTAGIAHEIQNPLNFVNNFSEVSVELVTELEDEQQKLDRDTELEVELLGDLKQNLQKIIHHGGRASSIVKGMLEHSRTGTGERQPADLNVLADEYLRLAYHGFIAKDKAFNSDLKTEFDPYLNFVNIVPQEIGRVLLNLYNNALYTVSEKIKKQSGAYQPTIWVSTKIIDKQVEIRVRDNGMGIPESVKAKIFQPFFTTKPTGEGTGLGLSLSYDIITKGHHGTLTVTSRQGQGSEFVITLPAIA